MTTIQTVLNIREYKKNVKIFKIYSKNGSEGVAKWFLGRDEYLKEISASVSIPCIRKDFTVDEYMIYEAKLLDAKAVLLICSILSSSLKRSHSPVFFERINKVYHTSFLLKSKKFPFFTFFAYSKPLFRF